MIASSSSCPSRCEAAGAGASSPRRNESRSPGSVGRAAESVGAPSAAGGARSSTTAVIACGALGAQLRQIVRRRGFDVELHCLPPLLHNHPERISSEVEQLARRLQESHAQVAVAYADCGTYGALDSVCDSLQLERLPGLHCYDVLAGADRISQLFADEPGTYLLTDFLVRSFRRTVLSELGLDRWPELWPDYFAHYRRVVWLAGSPTPELVAEAEAIAEMFGLPLSTVVTGSSGLEAELERLLERAAVPATKPPPVDPATKAPAPEPATVVRFGSAPLAPRGRVAQ
jgi:hypothetical protein